MPDDVSRLYYILYCVFTSYYVILFLLHDCWCTARCFFSPPVAFGGILFGLVGVFTNDYQAVMEHGFLQGYNTLTWITICLQVSCLACLSL